MIFKNIYFMCFKKSSFFCLWQFSSCYVSVLYSVIWLFCSLSFCANLDAAQETILVISVETYFKIILTHVLNCSVSCLDKMLLELRDEKGDLKCIVCICYVSERPKKKKNKVSEGQENAAAAKKKKIKEKVGFVSECISGILIIKRKIEWRSA